MKKFLAFVTIFSILFTFCSCADNSGADNSGADDASFTAKQAVSVDTVADKLMASLTFNDEMEENKNDEKTCAVYGFDESLVTDVVRYIGSGATAEELAIFECADSSNVKEVTDCINERIQYLHDGYSDYGPDQVPEIDNAFVKTYGKTVVFCICTNPDIIDGIVLELY